MNLPFDRGSVRLKKIVDRLSQAYKSYFRILSKPKLNRLRPFLNNVTSTTNIHPSRTLVIILKKKKKERKKRISTEMITISKRNAPFLLLRKNFKLNLSYASIPTYFFPPATNSLVNVGVPTFRFEPNCSTGDERGSISTFLLIFLRDIRTFYFFPFTL